MNAPVPVLKDIADVYYPDNLPAEKTRFSQLLSRFSKLYNTKPEYVSRSPGRVNIIGEHVDHQLYEVLPMAIASDVLIAVSKTEGPKISVANLDDSRFKTGEFSIPKNGQIEIDSSTLQWTNYFKAGFRGAVELLQKENPTLIPTGMSVLVDGSVPAGAGVSSSAAFVCASALAVLRANGRTKILKRDLTELAIVSERAVGVNSGGMDQAASVFSVQGDAVSVSFSPRLHVEAIRFPQAEPPFTFMIANSFVTANKHETGPIHYNLRVVECTLAAEYLAAKHGVTLPPDAGASGKSLHGLQNAYFASNGPGDSTKNHRQQVHEMFRITEAELTQKSGYTREEIASVLNITVPDLEERYMTAFPVRASRFLLRQRAQHVFSEALRVLQFKDLLLAPPSPEDPQNILLLPRLGALMNDTQLSCRDHYMNSIPELDQMCMIAREAGAYGSRVTGAGWGGCTVHLVPKSKVEAIRSAWLKKYYKPRDPGMTKEKLEEVGGWWSVSRGMGVWCKSYRSFLISIWAIVS